MNGKCNRSPEVFLKGGTAMQENDRLKKIDEKMAQLKAQRQAIINREKEKERKERTRRLIQNGALAEKYLACEGLSPEEFEKELQRIVAIPEVKQHK